MKVLVISDLHAPFVHTSAIDFLSDLNRDLRPDRIVCIGDEIDAHGWSRHGRHPDTPGQGDELRQAKLVLAPLFTLFPRAAVCNSNHAARVYRIAARAGLPEAAIKSPKQLIGAPRGWKWADSHLQAPRQRCGATSAPCRRRHNHRYAS